MGIVHIYRDLYTCIFVLGICGMDGMYEYAIHFFSHTNTVVVIQYFIINLMCYSI